MSEWYALSAICLSEEVLHPRRSGWRGVCEFVELPTATENRLGFEVLLSGSDWINPGEEAQAVLRFWAPAPEGLRLLAEARLLDGDREVARAKLLSLEIHSGGDS